MSYPIEQYKQALRSELVNYSRNAISKNQDAQNKLLRDILESIGIRRDYTDKPLQNPIIIFNCVKYLGKKDLARACRVSLLWKEQSSSCVLWSEILRLDTKLPLEDRIYSIYPQLQCYSKLFYERMSIKSEIKRLKKQQRETEDRLTTATIMLSLNFTPLLLKIIPSSPSIDYPIDY